MEQGGLRYCAPGRRGTDGALIQGLFADLLDGFESMAFRAFVFVKRHRQFSYHIEIHVTMIPSVDLVTKNFYWYKILCCFVRVRLRKNPGLGLGFFLASLRGE